MASCPKSLDFDIKLLVKKNSEFMSGIPWEGDIGC